MDRTDVRPHFVKFSLLFAVLALFTASACSRSPAPGSAPRPVPIPLSKRISQSGTASWYGPGFNGKPTTSGELYDQNALTAAHRTFPLGTNVRVTNTSNEKAIVVRINDRGPFVGERIIDLSFAAASAIGMIGPGTAEVLLEVVSSPVDISAVPKTVHYAVQLGSFTTREAADGARERFAKAAKKAEIVSVRAGDRALFRVRTGDFTDINEAKSEAARLKRLGIEGIVVER
jgi:rare lipoprotein A